MKISAPSFVLLAALLMPNASRPRSVGFATDLQQTDKPKTATVEVVSRRDWTSTGLIVKQGDWIRISATGTVTLDPKTGLTSDPAGRSDLPDSKKLMQDQPTGGLIAVIGADNDDFIFIG